MLDWASTFPGYTQLLTTAKKVFGRVIQTGPTPRHVGMIMDGNRRYAKTHKIELKEGHNMGFESMANILELLYESGVECATVYAFSIENFKRLSYEVNWLMDLAKLKFKQISQNGELCEQYGIKIKILGSTELLPPDVYSILKETEEITKDNTRAVLNICFPYTSRDEITNTIKNIVNESVQNNDFVVDENTVDRFLYTSNSPPLDILLRTSGTFRLSDFLLWQCVSSSCSIVFVDKLWPEFGPWDMCKVLINWSFNTYWYGNGSGYSTSNKNVRKNTYQLQPDIEKGTLIPITNSKGASGFERYTSEFEDDDDKKSDDYQSDIEDNNFVNESDTATSENEPDWKKSN